MAEAKAEVVEWDEVPLDVVDTDKAELAPKGRNMSKAEQRDLQLRSLEDDMLSGALEVVGGAIDFVELDPADPVKPEGWSDRRFRAALAGLENAKESPVGLKVATQFAVGAIKARAAEKAGARSLNVNVINFQAPRQSYGEVEVDD